MISKSNDELVAVVVGGSQHGNFVQRNLVCVQLHNPAGYVVRLGVQSAWFASCGNGTALSGRHDLGPVTTEDSATRRRDERPTSIVDTQIYPVNGLVPGELKQELRSGAGPSVDGLIRVTHSEKRRVPVIERERGDDAVQPGARSWYSSTIKYG